MRIAITASSSTPDAELERRFEAARYVLIFQSDGTLVESCNIADWLSVRDPKHSRLSAFLARKKVDYVITGLCMSGARELLERAGIKIVEAPSKTIREAWEHFANTRRLPR